MKYSVFIILIAVWQISTILLPILIIFSFGFWYQFKESFQEVNHFQDIMIFNDKDHKYSTRDLQSEITFNFLVPYCKLVLAFIYKASMSIAESQSFQNLKLNQIFFKKSILYLNHSFWMFNNLVNCYQKCSSLCIQ